MHDIEPYYSWRKYYEAAKDPSSPYYGQVHNAFVCRNTIYNYYIHPEWDELGSSTLYVKVLYVNYDAAYAVIELFGEWNDILHNDIMFLYRDLIDPMIDQGIKRFVLIGENVLNFHAGDNDYYQEWYDNIEDGWVICLNFRDHIRKEFERASLDYYFAFGGELDTFSWRTLNPAQLLLKLDKLITKRLST